MELTPDFLHTATESYKAEIRAVDFAEDEVREETRKEINQWAAAATNNLISEILPEGSLTDLSRFVLTNAIYFKGAWETRFPKSLTEDHKFHRLDGADPVDIPFMTLPGTSELFVSYNAAMSRYSMCVFLPDEDDGQHAMVSTLAEVGGSLLDHVPRHRSGVRKLLLPKLKLSFFCRLAQVLRGPGLREAFTEEAADLSGIVDKSVCNVRLDEVFHKAVIEVNEEGTVAAACAAVIGRKKKCAMRLEFITDHPFAFYIVEEVSGAVVFAGHVLDPSSSQ
ncbi:serpin-Z2A-like [Aegilops tauschii subsp. strangulata]|uniref:serpin-Z2A-like n=1 Tax=Aegilops tauschii subsp. strangulata TaxID=200361 RepID=UPI003CC8403A